MKLAKGKRDARLNLRPHTSSIVGERVASVADAKAHLASLLREVEQDRIQITVLRRGTPVARISPIEAVRQSSGFGWMRGSAEETGDIVGPTGEAWDLSDEEVA